MRNDIIGQEIPRIDAEIKVLGNAEYARDLEFAGLLEAAFLPSPYAYARILSINTDACRAVPGVVAVITGEDVSGIYGTTIKDRPILAQGVVRYVGEPVAAVAAVSKEIAQKALALIQVEYEEMEPVIDVMDAVAKEAPLLHENLMDYEREVIVNPVPNTNICSHFKIRKGNVEQAFAEADLVLEEDYEVPRNHHACIEPYTTVVKLEKEGILHIWTGNQSPYVLQRNIAALFGLPWNKVRVSIPTLGGGFGSKIYPSLEPLVVVLAQKCNHRPVRLALDRGDDFLRITNHGCKIRIKSGVRKDGKIMARQMTTYWDTGAYADCGPLVARNSGFTCAGPYQIDHVHVDAYAVYTNLPVATAFRGYGIPHMTWAYERHIDHIARELGLDPLEIRLLNVIKDGDKSHTGETMVAVGMKECLETVAKAVGWQPGQPPVPEVLPDGRVRSYGLAISWKGSMRHYGSTATVRIMEEGSVEVNVSNVDMGQGSSTIFAQMASAELGIPVEKIAVRHPDTFITPYDRTTSASRGTFHAGTAVMNAAKDAWNQMAAYAAKVFGCPAEAVTAENGRLINPLNGESLTFAAVINKAVLGGIDIIGRGYSRMEGGTGLDKETGQGANPTSFWMYAADAVEVETDTRTGEVKVLQIHAASDVGKAINRENCRQQIQGGVTMGLGIGRMEELKFDPQGRVLNNNFHDYKIPTSADVPAIHTYIVEVPHPLGPYGAKGLGEAPVGPVSAAIANAVFHGTGIKINRTPLTPENVKAAFRKEGK